MYVHLLDFCLCTGNYVFVPMFKRYYYVSRHASQQIP